MSTHAITPSSGPSVTGTGDTEFNSDLAFLTAYNSMLAQFKADIEAIIQKIEKEDHNHGHQHIGNQLVVLIVIFLMVMQDKYGLHIEAEGKL